MDLLPVITSICIGVILGYLGQRARLCFVGGIRDWILIRDTYLIKGLFAFIISALVGFGIFHFTSLAIKTFPWFINGGAVFTSKWAAMGINIVPSFMLPVPGDPITWSPSVVSHIILVLIGGLGVGFFSVMAGGCPFRQHVMAAEGSKSAIVYLFGFIIGAILFHKLIGPLVKIIFT
ncbi:MAG: YeeE/YedE thiosulfate transporter family protein [Spirochaetota bacterium]|nr:YeeE/YedE thiosulfate transporter family protein [Spirochaetota bacterium]